MFYLFNQNNSGGGFDVDDNVSHYTIIEADSAEEANSTAITKGIYFNGCEDDLDCPCCGDRWYPVDDSDGTEKPEVYSNADLQEASDKDVFIPSKHSVIVHMKNGDIIRV